MLLVRVLQCRCAGGQHLAGLVRLIQPDALLWLVARRCATRVGGAAWALLLVRVLPCCLGGALLRVLQFRCAGGQHLAGLCAPDPARCAALAGGRAVRCLCCNSTPWPVGLAAARAAVLVASTWLGWCARSSRGVLRATYPARCAALAGGQAVRNLGLPGCLGGALLRVLLGLLHRPLADGP